MDRLKDYVQFAEPFVRQTIRDGRRCVYLRFAPHAPILPPQNGLATIEINPHKGFDVEAQIIYLPLYPGDPEAEFNRAVFDELPNVLEDLLPDAGRFRELVRVFDLPAATGGLYARVVADPQSQRAVCYLE